MLDIIFILILIVGSRDIILILIIGTRILIMDMPDTLMVILLVMLIIFIFCYATP